MKSSPKPRKEVAIKRYPGISKVLVWDSKQEKYVEPKNGKFRAVKSIKRNRKSKTFDTFQEAMNWKNGYTSSSTDTASPLLSEIWKLYKESVYPTIEKSSIETKVYRSGFIQDLSKYKMCDLTPDKIDELIRARKQQAIKDKSSKRFNFDKELEELKVVFNWYRENGGYTYISPILKRHFTMGKIKDIPQKNKKMKPEEFMLFLDSLKQNCDVLFYDLAVTQFYTASRIGEMAGLQKECVDFSQEQLEIKYNVVWDRHRKFDYLKDTPKNGESRPCSINQTMKESLLRQYSLSKCSYVFQKDGKPLTYRDIQYNYNKALKKCGLFPKYQSTHIMRHSMASITRKVTGSADATQAVTGHKDIRQVEHYAGSPDNMQKQAVLDVEKFLKTNVVPFKKDETPSPQIPAEENLKCESQAG